MAVVEKLNVHSLNQTEGAGLSSTVGTLVKISEDGVAMVDYRQNTGAAIPARCALSEADCRKLHALPVSVLLVFEDNDESKPIITGIVRDKILLFDNDPAQKQEEVEGKLLKEVTQTKVDGKSITIDGREEILLRCGKSSILLRKDGKIVIKGSNLISRSSMTNKIKGSSVSIN